MKVLSSIGRYILIVTIVIAAFLFGKFYSTSNKEVEKKIFTYIEREDIRLALDENDNLMVIDNKTGTYTVYQDSIGNAIFKLYARNIWNNHIETPAPVSTTPVKKAKNKE